jgi:hypothetical protein
MSGAATGIWWQDQFFSKNVATMQTVRKVFYVWQRVARIFLGTMCKEEAHGDFDRRTMPADSKRFNSAFAISSFSGSRRQDFAKTGGWLPVGM